ncbi:MAG TPA: hypothetical protein VNJ01_09945 [Bacteriovoracaceae bacterium]|nr:hypothetical protein [Bacteriovoracaceae bacterium]
MKLHLLILLSVFTLSVRADENLCEVFNQEVLEKATIRDESANKRGQRFVKDEKEALGYIQKYDIQRLGLAYNRKLSKDWVSSCKGKGPHNSAHLPYCNSVIENVNFLSGLIHGLKHNQWSKGTRELALKKIWSYIDEARNNNESILDLAISINLLSYGSSENVFTGIDAAAIKQLDKQMEEENERLHKLAKQGTLSCEDLRASKKREKNSTEDFTKRLNKLIKG